MREYVRIVLEYLGILVLVILCWQLLEVIILGRVTPTLVDSIVGVVLTNSLHCNYKHWK